MDEPNKYVIKCMTTDTVNHNNRIYKLCKPCIICGESVDLNELEESQLYRSKVCDKCKQAILYIRKQIEEDKV
jgi:hypothetical protein